MTWWLEDDAGCSVRLPESGLLLGRQAGCGLVLQDPRASSLHALLLPTSGGVELRNLGRNPTRADGQPATRALLADGARLELPGASFVLRSRGAPSARWVLRVGPTRVGLHGPPLVLGSGPEADLRLPGGPPRLAAVSVAQQVVILEALAPLELRSEALEAGDLEPLLAGDRLHVGDALVELEAAGGPTGPTVGGLSLPVCAHFAFLPAGGRLELTFVDGSQVALELSELRARLVALLLEPPGAHTAGELVPDEVLLPGIWPGEAHRSRLDLNTLVHRTRKDLLGAGLNPAPLLVRPRAGRATALRLARGAEVSVT